MSCLRGQSRANDGQFRIGRHTRETAEASRCVCVRGVCRGSLCACVCACVCVLGLWGPCRSYGDRRALRGQTRLAASAPSDRRNAAELVDRQTNSEHSPLAEHTKFAASNAPKVNEAKRHGADRAASAAAHEARLCGGHSALPTALRSGSLLRRHSGVPHLRAQCNGTRIGGAR